MKESRKLRSFRENDRVDEDSDQLKGAERSKKRKEEKKRKGEQRSVEESIEPGGATVKTPTEIMVDTTTRPISVGSIRQEIKTIEPKDKPRTVSNFADLGNLLEIGALKAEHKPDTKTEPTKVVTRKNEMGQKIMEHKKSTVLEKVFDSLPEQLKRFFSDRISQLKSEAGSTSKILTLQRDPARYIREAIEQSRSASEKILLEKFQKELRKSLGKSLKSPDSTKITASNKPKMGSEENPLADLLPPEAENIAPVKPAPTPAEYPQAESVVTPSIAETPQETSIAPEEFDGGLGLRKELDVAQDTKSQETESTPTQVEREIEQELKKIPKEELQKIGTGINNIGFQVEKWKSGLFADAYNWLSTSKGKDGKVVQKKGFVANYMRAAKKRHLLNADRAQKKINAGPDARTLTKISNVAYLSKNILRPMRLIMDATGMSPTSALRWVMAGSMTASTVAGDIKEARFSDNKLLEKTQLEYENAEEEAWKIYEDAMEKGTGDITTDSLKLAYLNRIPQDLKERLQKTPDVGGIFKKDLFKMILRGDIERLNASISLIDKQEDVSSKEKEKQREQLLRTAEPLLMDYDRVLTKIGTIDQYAMWASYAEFGAKSVVRAMTAHTAYISLEKAWDMLSHIGYGHTTEILANTNHNQGPSPTATSTPMPTHTPVHIETVVPEKIPEFHETEIKFEDGKGGIQGVLDLKAKLRENFNNDFSHAPKNIQDFMAETNAVKQAKELGFLDEDGKSLKILEDATLKLDEHGKIVFNNNGVQEKVFLNYAPAKEIPAPDNVPHTEVAQEKPEIETKAYTPTEDIKQNEVAKELGIENEKIEPSDAFFDTYNPKQTPETLSSHRDQEKIRQSILEKITGGNTIPTKVDTLTASTQYLYGHTQSIAGNPFHLTPEALNEVDEINTANIYKLFFDRSNGWETIKSAPAYDILKSRGGFNEHSPIAGPAYKYINKLVKVTGLEPKRGWFFNGPENVQHFVARALQKAAEMKKLEELKIK